MSRDDLHQLANDDTPEIVKVPNTWPGLITWAVARVGPALVLAVAFIAAISYAVNKVYADLASTNKIVLEIVREQAVSNEGTAAAIRELSKQVENNTRAMDDAHRRAVSR